MIYPDNVSEIEDLYQNEQLFRIMAESSNVAIFLYRGDTPIYVNPAFERLTGYSLAELQEITGIAIIHPDFHDMVKERIKQRFSGQSAPNRYEIKYINKQGEERWAELSATLISLQGKATGLVSAIEITARKKAEAQQRESEQDLLNILNNLQDTYYRTQLDGEILRASPSINELLGYEPNEVIGTNIARYYIDPHGREKFLQFLKANNGEVKNYEAALRHKNGSEVWVATNARYYFDNEGEILGIEGTTRNISELKAAHEEIRQHRDRLEELVQERTLDLEALNSELESFSYSVSHDLRAPLRSIDGYSHILMDEYSARLDDEFNMYLQRIRASAQHMGRLIDDLLDLSRVSSGGIDKEYVDLSRLASEITESMKHSDPNRSIKFRVQPNLLIFADKNLLRVVLDNLLRNAWKYTQNNKDKPVIEFGKTDELDNAVFFVKDNGIGFDMQYANKLFSPFQRLHCHEKYEGTGIGLATVNRIIQRHGGRVWAKGKEGEGATFYFSMPNGK